MLVAAAVCPHPPLLVPGVAAGATAETDALRAACAAAVAALVAVEPDLLVVVGGALVVGPYPAGAWGSLRAYGPDDRDLGIVAGDGDPSLPLSLTIGRWLLDRAGESREPLCFGVTTDADAGRCLDLGGALAGRAGRVAMLVMGDGTTLRTPKGPGYLDERAEPFDAAVAEALRAVDVDALAGLDVGLATELGVAGRAPWQVLAGAAAATEGVRPWRGEVTYDAAPYGVGYLVATWLPA